MSNEVSEKPSRNPFFIILAVTFLPMALAYVVYQTGLGVPRDTVNQGTLLIPPSHISELPLSPEDQQTFSEEKRWRIFIPVADQCNKACEDKLFITRQVHIRLGEKSRRVQRYAISLGGVKSESYIDNLRAQHPKLLSLSISPTAWSAWLAKTNLGQQASTVEDYFLLVDQQGYAMMYYTPSHTGSHLLKDIKRLLKYSYED